MKNVLFLVTGMTPQIITETLWALACDPDNDNQWTPDEIHVLSTEDGLNQIRSRLFGEKEGFKFDKLKQYYPALSHIAFDDSDKHLHVIIDKAGNILQDLKTPEDNECAADIICKKVREFTQDDEVSLHVSIAGGRKTMGFYAGYALSLYGRAQDRMSHVLVEERYESARDFFYPVPDDGVFVTNREGVELKAKDAQIWLADIPFVRLRASLNANDMVSNKSFSEVVGMLNLSVQPLAIVLDGEKRTVAIADKQCRLTPKAYSLFELACELTQQGKTLYYPSKDIDEDNIGEAAQRRFNEIYGRYKAKDDVLVNHDYVRDALAAMKKEFKKTFGVKMTEKIMIQPKDGAYGIRLVPSAITIH